MIAIHSYATWKSLHEDEKSNHFTLRVVAKMLKKLKVYQQFLDQEVSYYEWFY